MDADLALARQLLEIRRDLGGSLQPPLVLYMPNGSPITEPEQLTIGMMFCCGDEPGYVHKQGFADREERWKGYRGACISGMQGY